MAIYNVKCEDCKTINEMIIKVDQVDENNNIKEVPCPTCGAMKLVKLPSFEGGSFQCTGPGWFKTGGY
jgi:predicted nucleic acid-binding Zn ribbon protein